MNTSSLLLVQDNLVIIDNNGVEQPAWEHDDGTIISHWDSLPRLLIQDENGVNEIEHSLAIELGYENA